MMIFQFEDRDRQIQKTDQTCPAKKSKLPILIQSFQWPSPDLASTPGLPFQVPLKLHFPSLSFTAITPNPRLFHLQPQAPSAEFCRCRLKSWTDMSIPFTRVMCRLRTRLFWVESPCIFVSVWTSQSERQQTKMTASVSDVMFRGHRGAQSLSMFWQHWQGLLGLCRKNWDAVVTGLSPTFYKAS